MPMYAVLSALALAAPSIQVDEGVTEIRTCRISALFLRDLAGISTADAAACAGLTGTPPQKRPAPTTFAVRSSLPDWLAAILERNLGPDAEAFANAIKVPGPITFRTNTLVRDREQLARRLADEGVDTAPGR